MIILSGLGLNYKTSICNILQQDCPNIKISYSQSDLYKKMNDMIGAPNYYYVDKVREEYLRAVYTKPDIMDRGPEDALVFELLKADGKIPNIWSYAWTYIYEKRNEYVKLINTLGARRYFLANTNLDNINRIINELKENDPTDRLVVYDCTEEYCRIQDEFYNKYKELFPDHQLIEFSNDDVETDIYNFIDTLKSEWSE